jgi:GNAT superfamily N-acetyltransferase
MSTAERKPLLTGGCQCGAVRYALHARPEGAHLCHCRMCQKAVGGPFAALAPVRSRELTWMRGRPAVFASSSAAERGFCAACGTPLTFRYLRREGWIEVTIGSLDRPAEVAPERHYGSGSRLPWLDGLEALPAKVTGENDPPEDLEHLRGFQHPDHDTPPGWRPEQEAGPPPPGLPMPATIRPWRPSDRPAVVALTAELQEHERALRPSRRPGAEMKEEYVAAMEAALADAGEGGALLVAEAADGRIVGYATGFVDKDTLELEQPEVRIEDLVVARGARRQGIGRALVASACRFARERAIGRVVVSLLAVNALASAAYAALGFRPMYVTLELDPTAEPPALS